MAGYSFMTEIKTLAVVISTIWFLKNTGSQLCTLLHDLLCRFYNLFSITMQLVA
ncbi:hypothetical protein [Alkanindiges illinoisensis]|uniref:hypothetical protein n=1 Tax=Alkanindiges illinoisensis TaxID=197183 RepID=UPI00141950AC|nr:hypothetical protein [Alkanindiges illinoisensis]